MTAFAHLHVHSLYSPMSGVASLDRLCSAAHDQQAEYLALTDTNGLYGVIRFLDAACHAKLKPILGAELTHQHHRAVLLAKSVEGYANLCRLLSARHCDADFDLIAAVTAHRSGLIILSDDTHALTAWKQESPEDLYVELTPGSMLHEALAYSRRVGLPPVATNRVQFIMPESVALHRLLRAIALNTTLSRLPASACCAPSHWLMPLSVMARQFAHVPHALTNTVRIAEQCYTDWDFKETIFPAFRSLTDDQAFAVLRERTYHGAAWRYGTITSVVKSRIEHELSVIQSKQYSHYFLVVDEIVREAPWTCGRGSAAASIVAYCLGVTHVDPIRHHLFFERFLNPGRQDPPDIDIDFPWDERDTILDKVFARYGTQCAAMVANQNTLGLRAALRETAKVYGMPPNEVKQLTDRIMRHVEFIQHEDIPTQQRWVVRLTRELQLRDPWPEITSFALQLEGHFRHLSVHCGGIVIVPDEIRRYVPVEIAAKGVPVIQWEKDQSEEAGLVKIDLLGNRSLAVIRDALDAIARHTGHRIDYALWDPLSDPATQQLIQRGDTMGCFYIESPATRLLLKKLWTHMPVARRAVADVFEYLVIVSSLIRPAASRFIREFVRRAHGEPYQTPHPVLDEVLAETFGIMVYQEDVTKVAMALAGFSVEDADQLRKVLSKKHKVRQLLDYRAQFYHGASAHGASRQAVDAIWEMIMSFAGYSFCKPHSASYAQVSFKSAYLRAHYPAEFMASVISNQGGFYSTFAYLSECRRMGLTILPPDINASEWAYTGHINTVRVGFMQLTHLSQEIAAKVIAERTKRGPFTSCSNFLERMNPEQAQTRLFIKAGCFDTIAGELTRPALLWRLKAYLAGVASTYLPVPPEYPASRRLHDEFETLGFPLSQHPMDRYRDMLTHLRYLPAKDMADHVGQSVTMIGVMVTSKAVHTKDGEPMEFVSFEDETGLYDATLFPDVYRRVYQSLTLNSPYVLHGLIEEDYGVLTLTVEQLDCLEAGIAEISQAYEIEDAV
ncbi:MAG: DNA polymerase III subunit alpha [Nitrospiraceae bacterium]